MVGTTKNIPQKPGNDRILKPGLLRCLAAIFYDFLLLLGILFIATALLLPFNGGQAFTGQQILFPLYLLLVSYLFYAWFWTHGGQTLGLRAWKIKVLTREMKPISWKQASLRFIFALISWGVFGLGFLWILIDKNKCSWHDHLSRTALFLDLQDT